MKKYVKWFGNQFTARLGKVPLTKRKLTEDSDNERQKLWIFKSFTKRISCLKKINGWKRKRNGHEARWLGLGGGGEHGPTRINTKVGQTHSWMMTLYVPSILE